MALAELIGSPGGLAFVQEHDYQLYVPAGSWGVAEPPPMPWQELPRDDLMTHMEKSGWIVDGDGEEGVPTGIGSHFLTAIESGAWRPSRPAAAARGPVRLCRLAKAKEGLSADPTRTSICCERAAADGELPRPALRHTTPGRSAAVTTLQKSLERMSRVLKQLRFGTAQNPPQPTGPA